MIDLALDLEAYLLDRPHWVPIAEIEQRFGIGERQLRAEGKRRAIHARFAITSSAPGEGNHGLKHIAHATVAERLKYKHGKRRVLIAYARAIKDYNAALGHALQGKFQAIQFDAHGHGVFSAL